MKKADRKAKAKAKWTKLEAIVGHPERIRNLARDIVTHFENGKPYLRERR